MIVGKKSYVFSGEDDREVILPLPLAFLRLVASGLYTYEINWQDDDWQASEPTSEKLSIIEGALSAVSSAIDGNGVDTMRFISTATSTLFSEQVLFQTGYNEQITPAMLPVEAQGASALLVNVLITFPYYGVNLVVSDLAGNAQQFIRLPQSGANRMDAIVPMSNGGGKLQITAQPLDSFEWLCRLIGWWE